jgi:hypothetical protein
MEISVGAAAFWIALAAVLIAGGWFKSRSEAMKHETIRRIIERTGQVDEVTLKALCEPPVPDWVRARNETVREILAKTERVDEAVINELLRPPPAPWGSPSTQGDAYRILRGLGAILVFAAIGVVICFAILSRGGAEQQADALIGFAVASAIALFGAGVFFSSRFAEKPLPPQGDHG